LIAGKKESDSGYLTYLRYNMWLDNAHLELLMGKPYSKQQVDGLVEMSNAESRFELYDIGNKAAQKEVKADHFSEKFKLQKAVV